MNKYIEDYNAAVAAYPTHLAEMQKLERANDVFIAPESKINEYQYVLDEETCNYFCSQLEKPPTQQQSTSSNCECKFIGPKTIELTDNQTDAVRIWNNDSQVKNITILDNRVYDTAHRDAIQLIPPKIIDNTRKVTMLKDGREQEQDWVLCDQMSAAILENVVVDSCTIQSPQGPLQGVFSTDGLFSNLKITNNTIQTAGEHSINVNGFLSGEITGNILRVVGDKKPAIRLYPARIGGHQAEEGVAYILGFANQEANQASLQYSKAIANNNWIEDKTGKVAAEIQDLRYDIPENYRWHSFGLADFNYSTFRNEFSTLTFGQYRTLNNGAYFTQLKAWLEDRISEYTSGVRVMKDYLPDILPNKLPSDERHTHTLNTLQNALTTALNNKTYDHVSISNLPVTPIKVFVAKQLALKHGKLKKLVAVHGLSEDRPAELMEKRRLAILKYLLTDEQLKDTAPNPLPDPTFAQNNAGAAGAAGSTVVKPINATGAYGTGLKDDLMMSAASVAKGEEITFFFKDGSPYNTGYSFFWRIANIDSSVVAFGTASRYTINTSNLDVKADYRVQVVVRKEHDSLSGGAIFGITPKLANNATQIQPPKEAEPLALSKNYGQLTILAKPLSVQQGTSIIFSGQPKEPISSDAKTTWYWLADGKTASTPTFTLDTTGLAVGEHTVKATLYVTLAGQTQRTSIPGTAIFSVTEKVVVPEPPPPAPVLPKPLTASGALKDHLRVSSTAVPQGETITLSIDPSYLATQQQGAKLSYYWTAPNNEPGKEASYTIKTDSLTSGKNDYVARVTLYKQLEGSTTKTSISGVATFGVTASQLVNTGIISVVVLDNNTQQPIVGEKYTLTLDADSTKAYIGITDNDGIILINNMPLGNYTLRFDDPTLMITQL